MVFVPAQTANKIRHLLQNLARRLGHLLQAIARIVTTPVAVFIHATLIAVQTADIKV